MTKRIVAVIALLCVPALTVSVRSQSPPQRAIEVAHKGAEVGKWTMDVDAAAVLARKGDLPLFYCFTGSDWCPYCKVLDKEVFATAQWREYAADRLLLVYIDRPEDVALVPAEYRERNSQLHNRFATRGVPTCVVFDSDNKTVIGQFGLPSDGAKPAPFIRQVTAALRQRPAAIESFVGALSGEDAEVYRQTLKQHGETQREFESWLATRPRKSEKNEALFNNYKTKLATLERRLEATELRVVLRKLDPQAAQCLQTLAKTDDYAREVETLAKAKSELQTWLLQRPVDNEKNRAKLRKLKAQLQAALGKLADLSR